jgi:hypothetical protein
MLWIASKDNQQMQSINIHSEYSGVELNEDVINKEANHCKHYKQKIHILKHSLQTENKYS